MDTLTKSVILNPGQSQSVSFRVAPQVAGVYSVRVDGLTESFRATEAPTFDPWQYDTDKSCYIEFVEWVKAIDDWDAGLITEAQRLQVGSLYQNNTRNPACIIDYTGKHAWCAYRQSHEFPGLNQTTWVVTEVEGKIGNLSVDLTKAGLAGMEATFKITTGEETFAGDEWIAVEVLGWWQYGKFITGVTIYDYNFSPTKAITRKVDAYPGEMLQYHVAIHSSGVNIRIWNSGGDQIFEYFYECDPKRLLELNTELEYWRYYNRDNGVITIQNGRFLFAGKVTLDRVYREGIGWLYPVDVCSYRPPDINATVGICDPRTGILTYEHYSVGGSWVFEGQVNDEV